MRHRKLTTLELLFYGFSFAPLIVALSFWKMIWVLPLLLAAIGLISSYHHRPRYFVALVASASGLLGMSFITNIWMDGPPSNLIALEAVLGWDEQDFGSTPLFLLDAVFTMIIVSLAAKLTFKRQIPASPAHPPHAQA